MDDPPQLEIIVSVKKKIQQNGSKKEYLHSDDDIVPAVRHWGVMESFDRGSNKARVCNVLKLLKGPVNPNDLFCYDSAQFNGLLNASLSSNTEIFAS